MYFCILHDRRHQQRVSVPSQPRRLLDGGPIL
nr:MAG TPA: Beta-carotene 15,15'-dioxygenase [Caudoviricetes sp.]